MKQGSGGARVSARVVFDQADDDAHRGGHILFRPDGYLWFGMGDGSLLEGGESVQGDPQGQAQTLDNWNGKMLRLDPNPSEGYPYSIPQNNPYADKKGTRPEIYLSGMRNPWRFSFDRRTDDLWIGDVGQHILEEIDFLPKARPAGGILGGTDSKERSSSRALLHPMPSLLCTCATTTTAAARS